MRDSLKMSTKIVRAEQDWCTEDVRGGGQDWNRIRVPCLCHTAVVYHDMLRESGQEIIEENKLDE